MLYPHILTITCVLEQDCSFLVRKQRLISPYPWLHAEQFFKR